VIGISGDSPFSHAAWATQMELNFPLLSDWNFDAAKAFDVYVERQFDWYRPLNLRSAFLVDTGGVVRWARVNPENQGDLVHPDDLVEAAKSAL
jgi:peroxiredoxin